MKEYSTLPQTPALLKLHDQIVLCYFSDTRLGNLILLQRFSRHILQPQPAWRRLDICTSWFINKAPEQYISFLRPQSVILTFFYTLTYFNRILIIIISLACLNIGLAVRVFANDPGDLGSIPGRVIPKTQKMVLDASLLNTQHYRYGSRVKWSNPGKGVVPSPTHWCSKLSIREHSGHPRLRVDNLLLFR